MTRSEIVYYFVSQMKRQYSIDCYWHRGRLVTRARNPRKQKHKPPEGGIFIGSYVRFFPADEFISDLEAAIARNADDPSLILPDLD